MRTVEVTWGALLALVAANPSYPSRVGVDAGNIRLPDATYYATRSIR